MKRVLGRLPLKPENLAILIAILLAAGMLVFAGLVLFGVVVPREDPSARIERLWGAERAEIHNYSVELSVLASGMKESEAALRTFAESHSVMPFGEWSQADRLEYDAIVSRFSREASIYTVVCEWYTQMHNKLRSTQAESGYSRQCPR